MALRTYLPLPSPSAVPAQRTRARAPTGIAVAVAGAASAVVVSVGGSPAWQVARVVATVLATVVALQVAARVRRSALGALALGLGVVAASAGGGIGVGHLVKGALTVKGVAGLVVFAAGLLLLVIGGTLATLTLRGWWRLLALPAAFLLVQFVLVAAPFAVYATNVPPIPLADRSPADLGLTYEDVVLPTADGVAPSAWYLPSRNGAAVALAHGSGSTRTAVLPQAAVLWEAGYGVLLYDDRGHGRSGGVAMDFGWWGDLDLDAALDFLTGQPGVDPSRLGVVGMSMGGEQAVNAAAADERIQAVVAEGLQARVPGDIVAGLDGFPGFVDRVNLTTIVATARLLTNAPVPIAQPAALAATAPRPVLLIAGRGEVAHAQALAAGAPGNVEVWALPDTPHTAGVREHPAQWRARVTAFLGTALAG